MSCSKCGHEITSQKGAIQNRASCPGCSKKPGALKTDHQGNCISICDIGMVEFVRDYQDQYNVSEREAVRQFVDTVKTNLPSDNPVTDTLTEESVNAKVRRATGKKKEKVAQKVAPKTAQLRKSALSQSAPEPYPLRRVSIFNRLDHEALIKHNATLQG